jgi:hypothetical protein
MACLQQQRIKRRSARVNEAEAELRHRQLERAADTGAAPAAPASTADGAVEPGSSTGAPASATDQPRTD